MNIPTPVRYANYRGDVASTFTIGELKGPNLHNELLTVVSANYNLELDQTRIGFSFRKMEVTCETSSC